MIAARSLRAREDINGLTGLILIVLCCLITFTTKSMFWHAFCALWLLAIIVYLDALDKAIMAGTLYALSWIWLNQLAPLGIRFPSPLLFSLILKFSLPIMAGIITGLIPSGKVLQSLRKLPFSDSVMLVVVVLLRFAPTVAGEFREVREAMKVRGMIGKFQGLRRPLKTLEFAVVPLIFRSIKVADELAAASMVRGIESPYKKTGYYEDTFSHKDVIIIGVSLVIAIICLMK